MRKGRPNISGQAGAIALLVGIAIVVVVVLVIVDVATNPPPTPQETCNLVHHIILPDACVCSVASKSCHPTKTKPYLIFFQQAAACPTLGCDIDLRNR
jgi:hypothetical protein